MANETLITYLKDELGGDAFKAELAKVLSADATPDHFVAVLINKVKEDKAKLTALAEDPMARRSLMQESIKCAADGLLPDGREATINISKKNTGTRDAPNWVVIFQYMPMVQGLVKTIYNTGLASNVTTGVIHEKDDYDYDMGSNPFIKHKPALSGRGERIAAFASVVLKGHIHPIVEIMTKDDVESVQSRSKSKDNGPWKTDTSEMWRKSVLRRLTKRLPRSASAKKLEEVLQSDEVDYDLSTAVEEASAADDMPKGLAKVAETTVESTEELI